MSDIKSKIFLEDNFSPVLASLVSNINVSVNAMERLNAVSGNLAGISRVQPSFVSEVVRPPDIAPSVSELNVGGRMPANINGDIVSQQGFNEAVRMTRAESAKACAAVAQIGNAVKANELAQKRYNSATDELNESAGKVRTATASVGENIRRNYVEQKRHNYATGELTGPVGKVGAATASIGQNIRQNCVEQKRYTDATVKAADATDKMAGKLKSIVGAYVGLQGVRQLAGLSDSMVQSTARLGMLTEGPQETEALKQSIYQSAQRSRGSFMDTADSVAKLGLLAGDAFGNTDEIVRFTETFQKMAKISGSSASEASNAMYQLNQAMASGRLQGDEFRSIIENAPMMAQAIADFTGRSRAELKDMSSEGLITAEVIKGAMFSVSESVDNRFKSMPMTWSDVMSRAMNSIIMAGQPVLNLINLLAQHWDSLSPVVYGLAVAVGVYTLGLGVHTAATWVATGAAKAFFTTLLHNPLTWVALGVAVLIGWLSHWIQAVGGVKIAWLIMVDWVLSGWDSVRIGFYKGTTFIENSCLKFSGAVEGLKVNVVNSFGDMKVKALSILEDMVNGAIDRINDMIGTVNNIPGVNFSLVKQVSFASDAAIRNEAEKQARNGELAKYHAANEAVMRQNELRLEGMRKQAEYDAYVRRQNIRHEEAMKVSDSKAPDVDAIAQAVAGETYDVRVNDDVNLADESLKYLLEGVTMKYINNVNLSSPAPTMNVTINSGSNEISESEIEEKIFGKFGVMLAEKREASTTIAY